MDAVAGHRSWRILVCVGLFCPLEKDFLVGIVF